MPVVSNGEAEAIALALQVKADWIILDEREILTKT